MPRSNNTVKDIERENDICNKIENENYNFKEVHSLFYRTLTIRYIKDIYRAAKLRRILGNYMSTNNISSSYLTEILDLNIYDQKNLAILIQNKQITRKDLRERKKKLEKISPDKSSQKEKDLKRALLLEKMNGVNSEIKVVNKFKEIAQKVILTMRKTKLEKYTKKTQEFCLEIMSKVSEHLKSQLETETRKVIIIDQEE